MLSDYISEEAVELLVAYLFARPGAYLPPATAHTGFVRFLRLLSTHDWLGEALVVDIPEVLNSDQRSVLVKEFAERREKLPVLVIATSLDPEGVRWTSATPNKVVFARLVALARASEKAYYDMVDALSTGDSSQAAANPLALFRTPLDDFDCVIRLRGDRLPRIIQAVDFNDLVCTFDKASPCSLASFFFIPFTSQPFYLFLYLLSRSLPNSMSLTRSLSSIIFLPSD